MPRLTPQLLPRTPQTSPQATASRVSMVLPGKVGTPPTARTSSSTRLCLSEICVQALLEVRTHAILSPSLFSSHGPAPCPVTALPPRPASIYSGSERPSDLAKVTRLQTWDFTEVCGTPEPLREGCPKPNPREGPGAAAAFRGVCLPPCRQCRLASSLAPTFAKRFSMFSLGMRTWSSLRKP